MLVWLLFLRREGEGWGAGCTTARDAPLSGRSEVEELSDSIRKVEESSSSSRGFGTSRSSFRWGAEEESEPTKLAEGTGEERAERAEREAEGTGEERAEKGVEEWAGASKHVQ